jgi:hypothetical protein
MAFWSNKENEPLRKFRFMVTFGEELWYAKSVTKPSFDVSTSEYQLINHKIKYPGIVTWNDIDIVIVDTKDIKKGVKYYDNLLSDGYDFDGNKDGINKLSSIEGDILITQLDAQGIGLEEWKLINPFVKAVKFGELDYSSDDLVEITITIAYDSAELSSRDN